MDSCRQPPDSALWMIKSCYRDHLPSRWRNRLDISNTPALAVHQGRSCPFVTEWLVWNSTSSDTQLESNIQHKGEKKNQRKEYITANNIQFERFVGCGISYRSAIRFVDRRVWSIKSRKIILGFKLVKAKTWHQKNDAIPIEMSS